MRNKNPLYPMLLLICTLIAGAHADIQYVQTMTMGDDQAGMPVVRTSHFVADGKERNETEVVIGNYHSKEAIVTICQPRQTFQIDDALKIYTIADNAAGGAAGGPLMMGHRAHSKEKEGTGKIIVNVKVTNLPAEKVADWDTKHYMVEMTTQSNGCVGDSKSTIKMELWVAGVKDAHACKAEVDYATILGRSDGGKCKVTYETTGDYARLAAIWDGLMMRQRTYHDGKVMMTQEITSLSQAKLNDSVFVVPNGYTKLSIADYNKKRQQAMMDAMMGGSQDDSAQNDGSSKNSKDKNRGFRIPKLPF